MQTYGKADFQRAIDTARRENGVARVRPTSASAVWFVSGRSAVYTVRARFGELYCSCPARALCWHMAAVWMWQLGRRAMRPAAWGRDLCAERDEREASYLEHAPTQAELLGLRRA